MANNIITAAFSSSTITYTKPAYQYDYGMILKFSGIELPQAYEVHFSNTEFCGESVSQIGDENGVTIPDSMFLTGNPIYAWVYLHTGEDDGETVYKAVIAVNKRAEPSNIEPTPVQQDAITQAIAALNVAVEQTAQDVIDAGASADDSEASALKSEGYAVGTQDGVAVEQGSPYYRHNSLWLSQQAGLSANKSEAQASLSEAWAVGEVSGNPVPSSYEQYHNNSKYYSEQAEESAQSVLGLTADATVDSNVGTPSVSVSVTTESDHKNMSFAFHNLKGVQGDIGVGISSVVLNADYTLTITLTNGTSYTTTSIRGEVGVTPNLTIGTVTTLPEGSQATATITGTDENPVLNLGIPVGDTGDPGVSPTITVTSITGGHSVAVTDAQGTQTFNVMDGEVSEEQLETALIDKADIITSSASGEIVTIADGGNDMPVVDLSVSLLPVQDLHGQAYPYQPGGGKNKIGLPLMEFGSLDKITGEEIAPPSGQNLYRSGYIWVRGNTQMTLSLVSKNFWPNAMYYDENKNYISYDSVTENVYAFTFTTPASCVFCRFYFNVGAETINKYFDTYQLQLETSSARTTFAPYENICPISGLTGVDVYHSDTDTSNPDVYQVSWQSSAGTVYGGVLDVTTGVLKADWVKYKFTKEDNYSGWGKSDGGTSSGDRYWISFYHSTSYAYQVTPNDGDDYGRFSWGKWERQSSADAFRAYITSSRTRVTMVMLAQGVNISNLATCKTWVEGICGNDYTKYPEVVFKLATPTTYQLTPSQIATFLGQNNFWMNANGTLDLEYRADTKLYIEQLTKPSEDDMVANANITLGSFFMVGNRLFLSSVAIAQGATIIPGTNCTEISLADALNQLNS